MDGDRLEIETRAGKRLRTGKFDIIPFARFYHLRIPHINGGLIWNRPIAVMAIAEDGQETVLPVHDETRRIQIAIFSGALLGWLLIRTLINTGNKVKGNTVWQPLRNQN